LILVLVGLAEQAYEFYRTIHDNRLLADPERIEIYEDTHPILVFAKAQALERAGDRQAAQRLYHDLRHRGDDRFRADVHYNLGTIYLREAAKIWNAVGVLEYARVNTLVSLAKENLRESLRLNPDQWDARFNLEYAHRITPPPKVRDKADWHGSKPSVFATLPTLPGGAP
jgi:mxaK protein